jgi:hypothetical protein
MIGDTIKYLTYEEKTNNEIKKFMKKLEIFKSIEIGDKIGKYKSGKGDYYIVKAGYTQTFWRYWYSENRSNTWIYLDEDFTEFVKYLDKILLKVNLNKFYKNCILTLLHFINDIIQGLYNLKKTYLEERKIVSKVDSIILILIDFKEKVNNSHKNMKKKSGNGKTLHSFDDLYIPPNYFDGIL